jgi:hemerythrin-like domain-containing protein
MRGFPPREPAMSLPTDILPQHHKHCDELFAAAEDAAQGTDWALAEKSFARFNAQMRAHFQAEEEVLFPAFEQTTGMTQGPTQMMRHEHQQMRSLLSQLEDACTRHDAEGYAGAAETLLMLMQQHNMKEENILYPMCDRTLGPQADAVCSRISEMLEERNA